MPKAFTFKNAIGTIDVNFTRENAMSTLHLKEFAKKRGQPEAAILLGLTQGALSKAIRVGRLILVTEQADGSFTAEERRPFPARSEAKSRTISGPTMTQMLPPATAQHISTAAAVNSSSTAQDSP